MSTVKKISGAAIATLAAGMILSGGQALASSEGAEEAKVHCYGVNACKGTTACKTADNACKGQNACKGSGWLPMSEAACAEAGGSVQD